MPDGFFLSNLPKDSFKGMCNLMWTVTHLWPPKVQIYLDVWCQDHSNTHTRHSAVPAATAHTPCRWVPSVTRVCVDKWFLSQNHVYDAWKMPSALGGFWSITSRFSFPSLRTTSSCLSLSSESAAHATEPASTTGAHRWKCFRGMMQNPLNSKDGASQETSCPLKHSEDRKQIMTSLISQWAFAKLTQTFQPNARGMQWVSVLFKKF